MTTITPTKLHFVYIIASGKSDGVFKLGISDDPNRRLKQIQRDYNVPDAYIVETMDVPSRDEVFAIESALHDKYDSQSASGYAGREWFVLSKQDLQDLKTMYREESNDFQQCSAFYGLIEARDAIALQADEAEMKRQTKIRHNRVKGKVYDTTPTGVLKRYNDLQRKIRSSTLGERFTERKYKHPVVGLHNHIVNNLVSITEDKLKHTARNLGVGGFIAGVLLSAGTMTDAYSAIGVGTAAGITGLISGAMTQVSRAQPEKQEASQDANEYILSAYPNTLSATQLVIFDTQKENEYLLRDYSEQTAKLRNQIPSRPIIREHVPPGLVKKFKSKNYFPVFASFITGLVCIIGVASTEPAEIEQRQERVSQVQMIQR